MMTTIVLPMATYLDFEALLSDQTMVEPDLPCMGLVTITSGDLSNAANVLSMAVKDFDFTHFGDEDWQGTLHTYRNTEAGYVIDKTHGVALHLQSPTTKKSTFCKFAHDPQGLVA
ncbi:hypothetical protein AB6D11_00810 [Vibrio splendidus]